MRSFLLATVLGVAAVGFGATSTAQAHEPGHRHGGPGYVGPGYHDLAPHWHNTRTPFGNVYSFGNGPHDYRPHGHQYTPWGGLRSYSYTPFGPTTSYSGYPSYGGVRPRYPWGW
ncbi:MAG TPA: hypothetical protein VKD90_29055 [Gemmataceae bacterium]|nr:hypothetical protein [Gemmataceae bacterium]